MAINKNALLRYQTLDKCFSNYGRKYTFEELLEIVNDKLAEDNPNTSGVQTRQLRDDIKFMKSEAGYEAPILYYRDSDKGYYRYENKDFSINNSPINSTEAEQLRAAISVLQRFEGAPGFEWMAELGPLLQDQFGLKGDHKKVMAFESNIDYKGYELLTPLFNAISNQRVLKVTYQPFRKDPFELTFHPYYLKQYNNRWFVLGRNEELDHDQWNLPLDRIEKIEETSDNYKEDQTDWEDHFYDVIGVTVPQGIETTEVKLIFAPEQAPYIETKPIHATQRHKYLENGSLEVKLMVKPNFELETLILSFGKNVEVIGPKELKLSVEERKK